MQWPIVFVDKAGRKEGGMRKGGRREEGRGRRGRRDGGDWIEFITCPRNHGSRYRVKISKIEKDKFKFSFQTKQPKGTRVACIANK